MKKKILAVLKFLISPITTLAYYLTKLLYKPLKKHRWILIIIAFCLTAIVLIIFHFGVKFVMGAK